MSDIDQSILDAMTEEERAALLDDDDTDDAIVVMPGDEGADDDGETDEGAGDDNSDEEKDEKAALDDANKAEADAATADTAKKQEQEQDQQDPPKPLFRAEVPADLADKYAAIDTKEEELLAKFEDGDMTTREYNAELRKLNDERNDLKWLERKAELSQETLQQQQETLQQQQEKVWLSTVQAFLPDHPVISESEENWNSFDQVLRTVTAVRINAGQPYGKAELDRAYKIWADERGIEVKAAAAKEPAPTAKAPAAKAPAAKDEQKKELPPTLAKVPAASNEDTDDGKYAALERLADKDPQAYQEAIAKMSASEYEQYTKFTG